MSFSPVPNCLKTSATLRAEMVSMQVLRRIAENNGYADISKQLGEEVRQLRLERWARWERNGAQIDAFKARKTKGE